MKFLMYNFLLTSLLEPGSPPLLSVSRDGMPVPSLSSSLIELYASTESHRIAPIRSLSCLRVPDICAVVPIPAKPTYRTVGDESRDQNSGIRWTNLSLSHPHRSTFVLHYITSIPFYNTQCLLKNKYEVDGMVTSRLPASAVLVHGDGAPIERSAG